MKIFASSLSLLHWKKKKPLNFSILHSINNQKGSMGSFVSSLNKALLLLTVRPKMMPWHLFKDNSTSSDTHGDFLLKKKNIRIRHYGWHNNSIYWFPNVSTVNVFLSRIFSEHCRGQLRFHWKYSTEEGVYRQNAWKPMKTIFVSPLVSNMNHFRTMRVRCIKSWGNLKRKKGCHILLPTYGNLKRIKIATTDM